MNKKFVFLIIVSFFIGIAIALLAGTRMKKEENRPTPPTTTLPGSQIPLPLIRETITSRSSITSTLTKEEVRIPKTLPFYQFDQQPLDNKEALDIAARLGFIDPPIEFTKVRDGTSWVWSSTTIGTLRVVPGLHLVNYYARSSGASKGTFPEDEKLIEVAKSFLASNGFIAREQAQFSTITFLADAGHDQLTLAEKKSADYADVHFREILEELPIVNDTMGVGTISVRINRVSRVAAAFIDLSGKLTKSLDVPLKQFDELISSLPKAKIQSLNSGTIEPVYQADVVVDSVVVRASSLAYLQEGDAGQQFLQPIFVLEGDGVLSDGRVVSVTLYLPARSEQSQ